MKIEYQFIRQALALARRARERGNHPFGALLEINGQVLLTAENTVRTESDPTGHAETNLIRKVSQELPEDKIKCATLYTSCEPCAMCVGAMYWAGIRQVVYALACEEFAQIAGDDFLIPCRDLFSHAREHVEIAGPFLTEEARAVHEGFWVKSS